MIILDMPKLFERPRHLVLAFMAGLSRAAGVGMWCYVEQLAAVLAQRDTETVS